MMLKILKLSLLRSRTSIISVFWTADNSVVYTATLLMEEAVYNEILMLLTFCHAEGKRVSFESSLH